MPNNPEIFAQEPMNFNDLYGGPLDSSESDEGGTSEVFTRNNQRKVTRENFEKILIKVVGEENDILLIESGVCTICYEEYSEKRVYRITPCKHIFHHECIYEWLITNKRKVCPNDNYRLR